MRSTASHLPTSSRATGWKISSNTASPIFFEPACFKQRQGEPLAQHRQMAAPEHFQRHVLHGIDVALDQHGIVVGAGAVGAGDQDHQLLAHRGISSSSRATRSGAEMMQLWPASIGR